MQLPQVVELKGMRVLTSKQLAEEYGTTTDRIKQNFGENREYFIEGKHYISLAGDDLRVFKNQVRKENNQVGKNALVASRTSHLYLWTEKGALLHAKSLNTDKAWQVYDYLVDFYFRAKEKKSLIENNNIQAKHISRKVNIANDLPIIQAIQKVQKDLTCMDVLLEKCKAAAWESKYNDDKYEAAEIATLITKDLCSLLELKPNIIKEITY